MMIFDAKISIFCSKFEFFAIFGNFQNLPSRPIIVENTWEIVRLKAYDPYFSKIKNFFIRPESEQFNRKCPPLVYGSANDPS